MIRPYRLCVICERCGAFSDRPTCALCDPDDVVKSDSDEQIPALRTAFRMGGFNAVRRLLGSDLGSDPRWLDPPVRQYVDDQEWLDAGAPSRDPE